MKRTLIVIALAGLSLVTWGTTETLAQPAAKPTSRPAQPNGVVITEVIAGTTAEQQGLRRGDCIIRVNGKPIKNVADLYEAIGHGVQRANLEIITGDTGELKLVTVTPRYGQIGVLSQPASLPLPTYPVNPSPQPLPLAPLVNPWYGGWQTLPWPPPVNPWDRGWHNLPWPPPINPWNGGWHPQPLPGPGAMPGP